MPFTRPSIGAPFITQFLGCPIPPKVCWRVGGRLPQLHCVDLHGREDAEVTTADVFRNEKKKTAGFWI